MSRITQEQIQQTYSQGKRVFNGEISIQQARNNVVTETGMNESSANGYINTFLKIMSGEEYTRTINANGTNYYLTNIKKDFGHGALLTALASIKKHLEYYQSVGKSNQPKIHEVLSAHIVNLDSASFDAYTDSFHQQVHLSLSDNKKARLSRLNVAIKKPKEIRVLTNVFIRNPDVVAETLSRAGGACERCNKPAPFIRAKDNTPYLEVHHKTKLADGGDDVIANTLALCPNCHRELHFGVKKQE